MTGSSLLVIFLIGAILGALIAQSKNLSPFLGVILGGFLSLLGLLILAVLPKQAPRG